MGAAVVPLIAALVATGLAVPAAAQSAPSEGDVRAREIAARVLAPWKPGDPVTPLWTWTDAAADVEGLRIVLQRTSDRHEVEVVLSPRDDARSRFLATPSFNLAYRAEEPGGSLPPDVRAALEALRRQIEANDPGGVTLPVLSAQGPPAPSPWGPRVRLALLVLFGLLVAGSAFVAVDAARAAPVPAWAGGLLMALTTLSFALAGWVSPHGFLHEYYHHTGWLQAALWGQGFQPMYGETGPALYRAMAWLTGSTEDAVFATNAILSALVVPATVLLDYSLFRRWPRALFAGLVLCLMPLHLRFAASEDPILPATLFALWTLILGLRYVDTRGVAPLLALVPALALVMQCRSELMAFPLVLFLFAWIARGRDALRAVLRWEVLAAGAAVAVLVLPRLADFLSSADGSRDLVTMDQVIGGAFRLEGRHVLLMAAVTPPFLWVLGAAGAGWAWYRERRALLALLLVGEGYALLTSSMFGNLEFLQRTQVFCTPYWAVGAAFAWPLAMERLAHRPRIRAAIAVLMVALPVQAAVARMDWVRQPTDATQEWDFLVETVPRLPDGDFTLIAVAQAPKTNDWDPFPAFLLKRAGRNGKVKDLRTVLDPPAGAQNGLPPAGPGLLFYQGMSCYVSKAPEPPPEPMAPPCLAMHRRFVLRPLFTRMVDGIPSSDLQYAGSGAGPWEIGFFEVVADRP